jgi:SAM-dependent methyltransferase
MLLAERAAHFARFVGEYERVRRAEGRVMRDKGTLVALPYRAPSANTAYEWRIRANSFDALVQRVVRPLELRRPGPLSVLDLGAGVGWLGYRLSCRGHDVAALDLTLNAFDGLGAHRLYDRPLVTVQAEYDRLPFAGATFDLVVYNASFHYSTDFAVTLREAMRVLREGGRVAVVDTPIYRASASGRAMIREREAAFERSWGVRGDALPSEGFLTYARLGELARALGIAWDTFEPWYGLRWWAKPYLARFRGRREPARFKLVVGHRAGHASG